jgi:hypothetical protein
MPPEYGSASERGALINVLHQETILHGGVGENGPLYTRLLATNPRGPNAGALLLTAEVYRDLEDGRPAFPIYRSLDGGRSWACIAQLRDDQLQHGHRHQPVIYELSEPFAGLRAGALLLAGNAIPRDMSSTQLVLYSSEDGGWSWTYRSSIDAGGPAIYDPSPQSTTTAVWEPELLLLDGRLVCFFADEREKHAGMLQAISMRFSTDLTTWTERVVVKGVADRQTRPGMFVSTGRMPDGWYRAVVEVVGPPEVPIHWLTSPDGLDWGAADDLGQRLTSAAGCPSSVHPTCTGARRLPGRSLCWRPAGWRSTGKECPSMPPCSTVTAVADPGSTSRCRQRQSAR